MTQKKTTPDVERSVAFAAYAQRWTHEVTVPASTPDSASALRSLTTVLKLACSGELAAALAYRGHWKSVSVADEIARIQQIEAEEWHHRQLLTEMLQVLGEKPSRWAEARAWLVGRVLGTLCQISGWLMPMYGAGRLESRNVREYESAARSAWLSGHGDWVDCLLIMAEVEWEHESYFRERVLSDRLGARLPLWSQPPPKHEIRQSFDNEFRPAQRRPTPIRPPSVDSKISP